MNDETAVEQIDPQSGEDALAQAFALLDSFAGEGLGHTCVDGRWVFADLTVGQLTEAFGLDCDAGWWRLLANRLAATKPIGDEEREAIRREALEDAARVAEGSLWFENRNNIARAIRALSPDDPLPVLKVKQLDKGDVRQGGGDG